MSNSLDEDYLAKLGHFGTELKNKSNMLNEIFIHQRSSSQLSFETVDLINFLQAKKVNVGFCEKSLNEIKF